MKKNPKITIIGAGAAGIGLGIMLKEFQWSDFVILEQGEVGSSFRRWPRQTRFITPSFTTNGFGFSDLNAVGVDTSPAYTLGKERLSGADFADYLTLAAKTYELPIETHCRVERLVKTDFGFHLETSRGTLNTDYVILALGEFQTPDRSMVGSELGLHYADITDWNHISGGESVIIGGNESGIDAAINLSQAGKRVKVLTSQTGLDAAVADPSIRLSPYTREKFAAEKRQGRITIETGVKIIKITAEPNGTYGLHDQNGTIHHSDSRPLLCTGFNNGALTLADDYFDRNGKGEALLNEWDESTLIPNLFLSGPSVRNGNGIFCYIYKFRQRFGVIINEIANRELTILDQERLAYYIDQGFYLVDCTDCGVDCTC